MFDGSLYWVGDVGFTCDIDPMLSGDCKAKAVKLRLSCQDQGAGQVLILEASTDGGQSWEHLVHDGDCNPVMNLTTSNIWTLLDCESTTVFTITE